MSDELHDQLEHVDLRLVLEVHIRRWLFAVAGLCYVLDLEDPVRSEQLLNEGANCLDLELQRIR